MRTVIYGAGRLWRSDLKPGAASRFQHGNADHCVLECRPTNVASPIDGEIACGFVQNGKSTGTL